MLKGQLQFADLAEHLQPPLVFVTGGQGSKLLQEGRAGRGGYVQEVLEGLWDGARGDPALVGPVTDHTWGKRQRTRKRRGGKRYLFLFWGNSEATFLMIWNVWLTDCPGNLVLG